MYNVVGVYKHLITMSTNMRGNCAEIVTYSYPIIHCCTIIIITMSYHVISPQLTVQCHSQKKTAPCVMSSGSAVVDLNIVYCSPYDSNSVYRYQLMEDQWNDLPLCPYRDSGLVVIDGVLTVVGGVDGISLVYQCRAQLLPPSVGS